MCWRSSGRSACGASGREKPISLTSMDILFAALKPMEENMNKNMERSMQPMSGSAFSFVSQFVFFFVCKHMQQPHLGPKYPQNAQQVRKVHPQHETKIGMTNVITTPGNPNAENGKMCECRPCRNWQTADDVPGLKQSFGCAIELPSASVRHVSRLGAGCRPNVYMGILLRSACPGRTK